MYIRLKTSAASRNPTVQVIESFRADGKVKQKIVASLGVVRNSEDKQRLVAMAQALINKMTGEQLEFGIAENIEKSNEDNISSKPVNPKNLIHIRDRISGFEDIYGQLIKQVGFWMNFWK